MKMKMILSEKEALDKKDECLVCLTHELAYDKIKDLIICPYCQTKNYIKTIINDFAVVGMGNFYEPEDEIYKYPVFECIECDREFALMPEKILHNYNHDIYYTGGKYYLNNDNEHEIFLKAQNKIKASLDKWAERYEKGEKIATMTVAIWIERDIKHAISEYLFENGFKK